MNADPKSDNPFNVLFISPTETLKEKALLFLDHHFDGKIDFTYSLTLQEGIEVIENDKKQFDLVIFEHRTTSQSIVKVLTELCSKSAFIMITPDEAVQSSFQFKVTNFEFATLTNFDTSFNKGLKKIFPKASASGNDSDYIDLNPDSLLAVAPLFADVFTKLGSGHFMRLFKKGDVFTKSELDYYKNKKGITHFYINKEEYNESIRAQTKKMAELAAQENVPSPEDAKKEVEKSLEIVRDLVSRAGFTAEAQAIAKSSVAVTLKIIGSKPRLATILTDLKKKDGNYITNHSLMLGQIACAMAYKVGWSSPATFFKLSIAAFIHDIALPNSPLAAVDSLANAKASRNFSEQELKLIQMHPIRAAEYTLKFNEIPPDVDQIVAQHHERPDGTGFPRGLGQKQISQLSALFIIAHELIDFSIHHPDVPIETYYEKNAELLNQGNFKKIIQALQLKTE